MIRNIPFRKLPVYSSEIKEVVKVLDDKPHLLVRITIRGDHFPHRAVEPLVRIITSEEGSIESLSAEVAADNSAIIGYLPVTVAAGTIQFGYQDEIWGSIGEFSPESVTRLDRNRLPQDMVIVDNTFVDHS